MKKYAFVFSNLKGYRFRFSCTMVATVLNGFLALLPTVIIGYIVDNVLYNKQGLSQSARIDRLWFYIMVFVGITLCDNYNSFYKPRGLLFYRAACCSRYPFKAVCQASDS